MAAVALLAVALFALHRDYLAAPSPLWDEKIYLDAGERFVAGGNPYAGRYFYPPPLLLVIAAAIRAGRTEALLLVWRCVNLGAVVGLGWLAARRTGWSLRYRLVAGLLIGLSPIVGQALRFGNLSPVVSFVALGGLALERRRSGLSALLLGSSIAFKPLALGAGAFLSGHRVVSGPRRPLPLAAYAWPVVAAVAIAPGAALLPAMFESMARPEFDPHHLSLRRAIAGLGFEASPIWIAAGVLLVTLWLARCRVLEPEEMVCWAPVVALLTLPVVWAHTFALTLPLQATALSRLASRTQAERSRRPLGPRDLGEIAWVLGAVTAIQGSAFALLVNHWPPTLQPLVCLIPALAPAALVAYLRASEPARPVPLPR